MTERQFIEELLVDAASTVWVRYEERHTLDVQSKKHANDLLTETDLAVQRFIVGRIREAYPDDFIVAEEEGQHIFPDDPNRRTWLIDPIDGTQNFVRGLFPEFGVSVALAEDNRPVVGGVAMPGIETTFMAEQGNGAYRNGAKMDVAGTDSLELSRVEIDFSNPPDRQATLDQASRVFVECGQVRCVCAAVVPLCSVAAGEMDGYIHVSLNPWDFAAGYILIEEAGGRVSRPDGSALNLFDSTAGIVATNGGIHDGLLGLLTLPNGVGAP